MATTKRYQSDLQPRIPQARNPFGYGQGISTPPPPNIPMPPRPSAAPPPPPHIYRPKTTPAEATARAGAQIASDLSRVLGQWGDVAYKHASKEAEKTGYETGLEYGLQTGRLELRGGTTIYDEAFNKGARLTYQSQITLDARAKIAELEIKAPLGPNSVAAFDRSSNAYREATLKAITDPESRAHAALKISQYATDARTRLLKTDFAENREKQVLTFSVALDGKRADIQNAIDKKNWGQAFNHLMDAEILIAEGNTAQYFDENDATTMRQELRDWTRRQVELEQFEAELATDRPIFDDDGNPTGQTTADLYYDHFAKNLPEDDVGDDVGSFQLDEGGDLSKGLGRAEFDHRMSPELHEEIANEMWRMRGKQRNIEAGVRAQEKARAGALLERLKARVKDDVTVLLAGEIPPGLTELRALVKGTPLAEELEEAVILNIGITEFRRKPLPDRAQHLFDQANNPEMTAGQVKLLKAQEALHNQTLSDIASGNGLLRAAKDGLFPEVKLTIPSIESAEQFTELMQKRDAMALLAESHYMLEPGAINRFSPSEVHELVRQYAASDTYERLELFGVIVGNLDPKPARDLLAEFDKAGVENLAIAGALHADGATKVAKGVLLGQAYVHTMPKPEGLAVDGSRVGMDQAIWDVVGNAYMGDVSNMALLHLTGAIKALYAYQSHIVNDHSGELDGPRLKAAINDVTGGIVELEWQGSVTLGPDLDYLVPVPVRGWTDDNMDAWLNGITVADIKRQGGIYPLENFTVEDFVEDYLNKGKLKLTYVEDDGERGYLLETTTGHFVLNPNGDPFILKYDPLTYALDDEEKGSGIVYDKGKGDFPIWDVRGLKNQ